MTWAHNAGGYCNHGCRCDACKAAWAAMRRAYRKRRLVTGGWRLLHGKFIHVPPAGTKP